MARKIISIFFLFFCFTTNAQQFLAKEGVITFFSEAPMEDIDAVNKKVSAVYDSKTNDLVFNEAANIVPIITPIITNIP